MKMIKKLLLFFLLTSISLQAREYFIYSVEHDLPMGHENETLRKNYYVNIGAKQGIQKGSVLNVMRLIIENDPYESKTRYTYRLKVGELEVIHQDEDASIAVSRNLNSDDVSPILEIKNFMVGDEVKIKVE